MKYGIICNLVFNMVLRINGLTPTIMIDLNSDNLMKP